MDLPDPGIEPGSPALQVDSVRIELSGKGRKGLEVFRVAEVISTCVRKLKLDLKVRFPKKPRGLAEILAQHISEPGAPPAARSSEVPAWKKLTAEREFSLFSKAGPATEITTVYCLVLWRSFGKCLYQPISWIY